MGRKKIVEEEPPADPTAWLLNNEFANFVLMHHNEVVSHVTVKGRSISSRDTPPAKFFAVEPEIFHRIDMVLCFRRRRRLCSLVTFLSKFYPILSSSHLFFLLFYPFRDTAEIHVHVRVHLHARE